MPLCSSDGHCFFVIRGRRKQRELSARNLEAQGPRSKSEYTGHHPILLVGLPRPLDFGIQVRVVEIIVVPEDAERVLGK